MKLSNNKTAMFAMISFVFLIPIVAVITWVALKQVSPLQDKEQPAAASGNEVITDTTNGNTLTDSTTTKDTASQVPDSVVNSSKGTDTTDTVTDEDTTTKTNDTTTTVNDDTTTKVTTTCETKTKGDANCDGSVAMDDWNIISEEYKTKCTETKTELCGDDEDGDGDAMDSDFDGDGLVGVADISIWNSNLQQASSN